MCDDAVGGVVINNGSIEEGVHTARTAVRIHLEAESVAVHVAVIDLYVITRAHS